MGRRSVVIIGVMSVGLMMTPSACHPGEGCPPHDPQTGAPQIRIGGKCVVQPPTTAPTMPTTTIVPPPAYPKTADEAGAAFGIPNSVAHYERVGQFGWHTELSVRLHLYPGLCVDFDLNADPSRVLTGQTEFVDRDSRMHRALMKSEGTILGGATVYWSTCNRL